MGAFVLRLIKIKKVLRDIEGEKSRKEKVKSLPFSLCKVLEITPSLEKGLSATSRAYAKWDLTGSPEELSSLNNPTLVHQTIRSTRYASCLVIAILYMYSAAVHQTREVYAHSLCYI